MASCAARLGAVCWLGLVLVLLFPETASAQRRRHLQEPGDPLCYRSHGPVCEKVRVAVLGGGILSTEGALPAIGVKGGVTWVMAPRVELGFNLLAMSDVRVDEGTYFGMGEGVLRFAPVAGEHHRVFLEVSAGISNFDGPEYNVWAFPAGGVAASFELSSPGMGVFLTTGLSIMRAERWSALPHAGVGLVF
jgi:hypothetical protein